MELTCRRAELWFASSMSFWACVVILVGSLSRSPLITTSVVSGSGRVAPAVTVWASAQEGIVKLRLKARADPDNRLKCKAMTHVRRGGGPEFSVQWLLCRDWRKDNTGSGEAVLRGGIARALRRG